MPANTLPVVHNMLQTYNHKINMSVTVTLHRTIGIIK